MPDHKAGLLLNPTTPKRWADRLRTYETPSSQARHSSRGQRKLRGYLLILQRHSGEWVASAPVVR
ncbi:hypothetical protein ABIA39_008806 [Nocardia sp. GAS34]